MKQLCVAVLVCLSAMAASADQAVWGPVTGRTNQVSIQRQLYGDIHASVDLTVAISDSSLVYGFAVTRTGTASTIAISHYQPSTLGSARLVRGSCDGSADNVCYGLNLPTTAGCTWASLPSATRTSLTQLLGSCSKLCYLVNGTLPSGETFSTENWSCQTAGTSNCQGMAGTLLGMRIDLITSASGCQY